MLNDIKDKSYTENCFIYFPFFNHKLYENPSEIQEEEYLSNSDSDSQNLEDSSTNISHDSLFSIDDEEKLIPLNLLDIYPNEDKEEEIIEEKKSQKEIQPELQKYILPKSLFFTNKIKNNKIESKNILQENKSSNTLLEKKLDLNSRAFIPKYRVYPFIMCNNALYCSKNKFGQLYLNYSNYYNSQKILEKKKKKKKTEFVEREGDWSCYRCKNINFSFRDICNKCQLSKDESEKKFIEAGEILLKLADSSIYEKK